MWVSHPSPGGPTFFITRMASGIIWLLSADAEEAPRVRLHLRTKRELRPFISMDGRLHFIEMLGKPTFCDTCWHTIDTATGATLASERKLKWHPALSREGSPCQAQTQRILAMANAHTITVLDACGLQEVAEIVLAPRHAGLSPADFSIGSICWSHDGAWIAVLLHPTNPDGPSLPLADSCSEIHIYTASGACWQSLPVIGEATVQWSPSFAYLAVYSKPEGLVIRWDAAQVGSTRKGAIWLLNPSEKAMIPVPEDQEEAYGSSYHGWSRCWWSSRGGLLIAQHDSPYCHILDGETGLLVYGNDQQTWLEWRYASWASHVEAACVPGGGTGLTPTYVQFQVIDGMWMPIMLKLANTVRRRVARISPYGTSIAIQDSDSLYAEGCVHHYDLDIEQSQVCVRRQVKAVEILSRRMSPAPLPGAWPVVDARIVYDPSLERSRDRHRPECYAVELVQAFGPHVLGTWTADDFLELAQGKLCFTSAPCEKIEGCTWAPNSRHLAVLCNKRTWVLVMTFREHM